MMNRWKKTTHVRPLPAIGWLAALAALMAFAALLLWPQAFWPRLAAPVLLVLALVTWGMAWRRLRIAEERARREMAAHRRLLAAVSHELRTPLNGLLGTIALLRATPLNAEQQNHVQTLDASARMLLSMVDELLERARLEEAKGDTLQMRPFDPARLVEEVCELLAPRAHARGLEIAAFVSPRVRGRHLGDPLRLKQVLLNLVGNAVKFTTRGGVLVRLEETPQGLHFTVEDTGPGVPPALERRLFDAFVRDESGDVAREGGAGLGLAISRQLVARMGGRLQLDNRPGQGACFHFTLPLPAVDRNTASAEPPCVATPWLLLLAPDGPVRRALAEQAMICGTKVDVAEELPPRLPDAGDVIVDARLEHLLPRLLQRTATRPTLRVWLLLRPEDRIRLHDWLTDPRLSGYLLRPVRRQTLFRLLSGQALEQMTDRSVRQLRELARTARPAADEAHPLVLLAEDDPVSAKVTQALLERFGCRVLHVADGASLVRVVESLLDQPPPERPALALVDVHMPIMNGIEAARAIRRLEAAHATPRLPLLALSGGDEKERALCQDAGMDGFLRKPVEPRALRAALSRHLELHTPDAAHGQHAAPHLA